MFNPAGHRGNPGRPLDKGYERGIAYQISKKLADRVGERYGVQCLVTRAPGEEILENQIASFANRAKANLLININVYREDSIKPKVAFYTQLYNPMVDLVPHVFSKFAFLLIEQAHIINISRTRQIADRMADILSGNEFRKKLDIYSPKGIPIKMLKGIVPPAIEIEIGLQEEDKYGSLIEPLVESMRVVLSF